MTREDFEIVEEFFNNPRTSKRLELRVRVYQNKVILTMDYETHNNGILSIDTAMYVGQELPPHPLPKHLIKLLKEVNEREK